MFGWKKDKKKNEQVVKEQQTQSQTVVRKVPELTTMYKTDTGNRKYQQDAYYITPSKILAANKKTRVMALVCDGMGGMADGGKASQTAIQMMTQGFKKIEKMPEVDIPAFFRQGIKAIDKVIHDFPKEDGKGSGTTMVACIAEDNKLYWASVGDSRIYIIRGNEMQQVTRDHNYWLRLMDKVKAGEMTMEEAQAKRRKEALISFLGIGNVSLMDINTTPFEMKYGDVIMLCSDGITKTLTDSQIKKIITEDSGAVKPDQKAQALVDAATHANSHSQDNTTVVLIHFQEKDIKQISADNR